MANNLINFYKEGISQPQLKEGVYTCKLKSHKLIDTKPENPYIALEFETETGRILKDNRFNQGFQIFISHIKQQLGRADEEIAVMDLLNELVEKGTEFKIWITKYTPANGGQTRSNFNFLEPRKKDASETGVEVTDANATAETPVRDEVEDDA